MTLQEAVQLAPKHNHDIRIASYTVEEKQHAKGIAKSSVALRLNQRPRKTLGFETPAGKLQASVASTG
jgi:IS30 family transposase